MPPARIADMKITVNDQKEGSIEAKWTAPGDDFDHG